MTDHAEKWQEYLDLLAKAKTLPDLTWAPEDVQLQAEVRQQVMMNITQAYFYFVVSDPSFPDFIPFFNSALKLQPNPDDAYYAARIDGRGVYRITGERGTVHVLNFTVANDFIGTTDTPGGQQGEISADDMVIAADGTFELVVSAERPGGYSGNWLRCTHESNYILVRMRSYDWGVERDPRLAIERLDGAARMPRMPAEEIDKRLREVVVFSERFSRQWYAYQDKLRDRGFVNELELTRFEDLGGGHMQVYWQGVFDIRPGECLLLQTPIPEQVRYWNVQLNDQLFNALEYYYCQSSLNGHQAQLDEDGWFRAVLAVEDPGVPNWLDTVGRRQGTVIGRWFGADTTPVPTLTRLPLADLRAHLPATTPMVDAATRDLVLRARVRGGQMRRRW